MEKGKLRTLLGSIRPNNRQKTEAILHKILTLYLRDLNKSYIKQYELEAFNSKDIEKMLTLLENSLSSIRKLALLVIGLVLMNPLSKIFFLEKCGLSLVIGRFFLTRLKYIFNFSINERNATKNVMKIMKILKISGNGPRGTMFWYIPFNPKKGKILEDFRPNVHEFRVHNMLNEEGQVDLSLVPDPVYNLCGLEFFIEDKNIKIEQQMASFKMAEAQKKTYTQSVVSGKRTSILNHKAPRQSYKGGVSRFLAQSSIHRSRIKPKKLGLKPLMGISRPNNKNPSLYFRSSIQKPSSNMMSNLDYRPSGSKLKQKLQNSLISGKRTKKLIDKSLFKHDKKDRFPKRNTFQFGTESTHNTDRGKPYKPKMGGLHLSEHDSKGVRDLKSKLAQRNRIGSGLMNKGYHKLNPNSMNRVIKGFKQT